MRQARGKKRRIGLKGTGEETEKDEMRKRRRGEVGGCKDIWIYTVREEKMEDGRREERRGSVFRSQSLSCLQLKPAGTSTGKHHQ